jgi:hypothetical protein
MGILDQTLDTLPSLEAKNWPLPLLTGVSGGHDLDLRRMAADGVTLLGHLQSVAGNTLSSRLISKRPWRGRMCGLLTSKN